MFAIAFLHLVIPAFAQDWIPVNSGTSLDLHQVKFADSVHGFIIGGNASQSIVLRTSDGGLSWNPVLNGHIAVGMAFLNSDTGAILGKDTVFKTFDGGSTWITIPVTDPNLFEATPLFHMNSAEEWFYISGQRHTHTYDGGMTWSVFGLGNSGSIPIVPTDMQILSDSTILGVGWYAAVTFISADGGASWGPHSEVPASFLYSLSFPSPQLGFVVSNLAILKAGTGTQWEVSSNIPGLRCIRHIDSLKLYAVGDGGTIVKTINGGSAWTSDNSGTTQNLRQIILLKGKAIVVGDNGTILVNTNIPEGLPTGINAPDDHGKVLIYPNPSRGLFHVNFPSQWSGVPVVIEIYNLAGEMISRAYGNGLSQTVQLKGRPAGLYFILFRWHGRSVVEKVLLQ